MRFSAYFCRSIINNFLLDSSISLNKFISDTGYCSRREADRLIEAGRVLLNNKIAATGNRWKPGDVVEVDGSIIKAPKQEQLIYIALNKPAGITTTTELHVAGNIISFINHPKRIFPIGRLDKDSEGLILLTSDGDIVNKVLRAGNRHEKEYIVRVNKPVHEGFVRQMASGIPLEEGMTEPCSIKMSGRQVFRITLTQGLNRQIRRMCAYLGYDVIALQRIRIMHIRLDKLPLGKWRNLSEAEVAQLKTAVADSSKTGSTATRKKIPRASSKPIDKAAGTGPAPGKVPVKKAVPQREAPRKGSFKEFRSKGRK